MIATTVSTRVPPRSVVRVCAAAGCEQEEDPPQEHPVPASPTAIGKGFGTALKIICSAAWVLGQQIACQIAVLRLSTVSPNPPSPGSHRMRHRCPIPEQGVGEPCQAIENGHRLNVRPGESELACASVRGGGKPHILADSWPALTLVAHPVFMQLFFGGCPSAEDSFRTVPLFAAIIVEISDS